MCIWRIFLKSMPSAPVLDINTTFIFSPFLLSSLVNAFKSPTLSGDNPFSPVIIVYVAG